MGVKRFLRKKRKTTLSILNLVFSVLAGTLACWFIISQWNALELILRSAKVSGLFFSFVLILLFVFFQGLLSATILRAMQFDLPYGRILPALFGSQLGKYIPGKIWVLTMRLTSLSRHAISPAKIIAASGVEHVFVISTGLLIFLISATGSEHHVRPLLVVAALAGFTVFVFFPSLIHNFVNKALWCFGRKPPIQRWLSRRQSLSFTILYTLNWLLLGAGIHKLVVSLAPSLPSGNYVKITGVFAFSVIAGFAAVFAPGGLGVREGIFALFLQTYMPTIQAVSLSIASRLVYSLAEFAIILIAIGFAWLGRSRE